MVDTETTSNYKKDWKKCDYLEVLNVSWVRLILEPELESLSNNSDSNLSPMINGSDLRLWLDHLDSDSVFVTRDSTAF